MNNDFRRLNISVHEFLVEIGIPIHLRGYKMIKYLLIEILNNIKSETELFEKFETIIETEKIQNLIDETINNINNVKQ